VSDQQEHFSGQVVGLSDGDTLFVLRDGKSAKVRLCGIDPPEKAQAFGTRAVHLRVRWRFGRPSR
jgi:endonuclease YncB( thermonuclease family)